MARPKKEDAIDIKGRAIAQSLALLRETPGQLSLSVLARRIGCSAPALYAHFRGKDDLLEHARAQAVAELSGSGAIGVATAAEAPGTRPLERIRDGGARLIALARENPAIYRLIFAPDHATADSQIDIAGLTIQPIARNLAEARTETGDAVDALAGTVWFTLHGAILAALDQQLAGPQDRRWDRAAAALDGVLALLDEAAASASRATLQGGAAMGGRM